MVKVKIIVGKGQSMSKNLGKEEWGPGVGNGPVRLLL